MTKSLNSIAITEVSKVLGEYTIGSELTKLFHRLGYFDYDSQNKLNKLSTKWRRIENTLQFECKNTNSAKPIIFLIEQILSPASFIKEPDRWNQAKIDINGILIFYGYQLNDSGKIEITEAAENFSDARKRLLSFEEKLSVYDIHPLVIEYCKEELFVDNYFHAIFEASKGISERVRNISECDLDGSSLINEVFKLKHPRIVIKGNMLESLTDKSQYSGLKSLLNTIVYLYRNPQAHEPKLYNPTSETDAMTAFTLISLAHRILDNCVNVRDILS